MEKEIIKESEPSPFIKECLEKIGSPNSIAIITRNTRENAILTLEKIGLINYFSEDFVIGRELFKPKPDPEAIEFLIQKWNCNKDQVCFVGDYFYDLQSGYNAGIDTIHYGKYINEKWPEITSYHITSFSSLIR